MNAAYKVDGAGKASKEIARGFYREALKAGALRLCMWTDANKYPKIV